MRFIGALETLLDPIVAVLDALPAHFSADHAPRDVLDLLSSWLGIDLDESQTPAQRRAMVRQAAELGRRRGTRAGLELALSLAFPKLPLRVEDLGGVRTAPPKEGIEAPPATFIVYCDKPIAEEVQAGVARCIEQYKPVGTTYRLRVKAAKKKDLRASKHEDVPELRPREPGRPGLLPVRGVPELGADGVRRGDHARDGRGGGRGVRRAGDARRRPRPPGAGAARRPGAAPPAAAARRAPAPVAAGPAADAGPRRRRRRRRRRRVQAPEEPEHEAATITLRLPEDEARQGRDARGRRAPRRAHARARDDPQPVRDRRQLPDLPSSGLPDEWFSVLPDTVYLVPYGTGGTYEQEVEIHLHPPRKPEAEARIWELQVTAHSKAQERTAATAPLMLGIQPFEQHDTKVKPERASGRRKADFKVAVANKANAPVYVAFAAKEADDDSTSSSPRSARRSRPARRSRRGCACARPSRSGSGARTSAGIDVQTKTGEEAQAIEARRSRRKPRPPSTRSSTARASAASSRARRSPACTARRSTSRRSTSPTSTSAPAASRHPSRWSAARR